MVTFLYRHNCSVLAVSCRKGPLTWRSSLGRGIDSYLSKDHTSLGYIPMNRIREPKSRRISTSSGKNSS